MIKILLQKLLCKLDEHTPKDTIEQEKGLHPFTMHEYRRCKYCNKRIVKDVFNNTWFAVEDKWLEG